MNAEVTIQTHIRNGVTSLQQGYATPPFKIADITEDKKAGVLELMLMSSSPGILDGDRYNIQVTVGENCRLRLHTQSYQRLFYMKNGASQRMQVQLQKGASFIYLPHPTVPHEQAVFTSRNKLYLHPESSLVWGEILTCGRKLNGELFHFSQYHSVTEIFSNNKLLVKENLLVQPALTPVQHIGQWEGHTHQASLIYYNNAAPITDIIETVFTYLSQQKDVALGISHAPGNGFIVRLLGYKAEQLYQYLQTIAVLAGSHSSTTTKQAQYAG